MKIGFELELFCRKPLENQTGGDYCLVPAGLPFDECGWLVEVRSEPHNDLRKAIALLNAELELVREQATKKGVILVQEPVAEIPRTLKVEAARKHIKGLIKYSNIYGHQTHKCKTQFATASLHVSFTNQKVKTFSKISWSLDGKFITKTEFKEDFQYPGFVDHAKIIVGLDKAFAQEIKAAQRNPGFYEVKSDGRIEYRSLPNTIDLAKLRVELEKLL